MGSEMNKAHVTGEATLSVDPGTQQLEDDPKVFLWRSNDRPLNLELFMPFV